MSKVVGTERIPFLVSCVGCGFCERCTALNAVKACITLEMVLVISAEYNDVNAVNLEGFCTIGVFLKRVLIFSLLVQLCSLLSSIYNL